MHLKPEKARKLIEKALAVKDRPGMGVYSKTPAGDPFFTNGHVLIMGKALETIFAQVVPNTEGPSFDTVVAGIRGARESRLPVIPFTTVACESRTPPSVYIHSEPCGLAYGDASFGDTVADTNRKIAINLRYYSLLTDLGFTNLVWEDGDSAALAYRQNEKTEIENDLTAIVMPLRQ